MTLVDTFEAERPRLLNVAYRLTGSVADAEDAVQEAWLRLDRTHATIDNLQAWLTTVVSRLCLDRLTSAAAREAWPPPDRPPATIDSRPAWLPTAASRVGLDGRTSAAARRGTSVGQGMPVAVVRPLEAATVPPDPLDAVVRDEDNRLAAL